MCLHRHESPGVHQETHRDVYMPRLAPTPNMTTCRAWVTRVPASRVSYWTWWSQDTRSPYLHHNGYPGDRFPEEDSEGAVIALIEIVCHLPVASWEQGVDRMKCVWLGLPDESQLPWERRLPSEAEFPSSGSSPVHLLSWLGAWHQAPLPSVSHIGTLNSGNRRGIICFKLMCGVHASSCLHLLCTITPALQLEKLSLARSPQG